MSPSPGPEPEPEPEPQRPVLSAGPVAAIVLAAGRSSRMGGANKLLATFQGVPLVRRSVVAALNSMASPVIVVTGYMSEAITDALSGLDIGIVHNARYAEGLATSMRAGLAAVPNRAVAALIALADMPGVSAEIIDTVLEAYACEPGPAIVVPTVSGLRGNPVLWSREFFRELANATGDVGGRNLIREHAASVRTVEIGEAAALDVDTPEALAGAGGILTG
jgi:molybdenum cofactor cytidylyltransferase